MSYKVYDIGEEVIEREKLTLTQITNLDNIFRLIHRDNETSNHYVLYELLTPISEKDSNNEHFLKTFNEEILNKKEVADEKINEICSTISNELYNAELIEVRGELRRNRNITKGILIIKIYEDKLILMKLEETEAIDRETFKLLDSLSLNKKYYKVCIFEKNDFNNIVIIDKNKIIAKYWANKFLKLSRKRDDATNTLSLIKLYREDRLLLETLEIESNKREEINNQIFSYISTSNEFDPENLFQSLDFKDEDQLTAENFIRNEAFDEIDNDFNIDKDVISSEFKEQVRITDNITITSKNLKHDILSERIEYENGRLVIRIPEEYEDRVRERFN